jgi:radical SAM superfamily enzyme YgiQ (UPF0313 family)
LRARGRMVVLGGPHPTLLPDEARPHADALVIGEAETTWPQLLADAARGALAREYGADETPSLEGLPQPRRDLIVGRGLLANTVIATRGCPHRCSYCNLRQIYAPALRFRPVEEVVAEVRSLKSPLLAFWDDQLFMDRRYALRALRGARGLEPAMGGATVSLLTPFPGTPLFQELQRAGRLLTQDWSYYNGKTA